MRTFACKDLDSECKVIRGNVEPQDPSDFHCRGNWENVMFSSESALYCRDLAPGTFRELKKLDVVSGEYEFVEEVPKVQTLLEAAVNHMKQHWSSYNEKGTEGIRNSICQTGNGKTALALAEAIDRELSKPAPRYDEKLIDELLETGGSGSIPFLLSEKPECFSLPANRRAAEILQALKRAKEGV